MTSVTLLKCPDLCIALVDIVFASSSGETKTGDRKNMLLLGGNITAAIPTPMNCPVLPRPSLHGKIL
jgi:hypothetical protein